LELRRFCCCGHELAQLLFAAADERTLTRGRCGNPHRWGSNQLSFKSLYDGLL